MTRVQLEHIIRAAAGNADAREIVIVAQTSRLQEAGKALALSRLGRLAND